MQQSQPCLLGRGFAPGGDIALRYSSTIDHHNNAFRVLQPLFSTILTASAVVLLALVLLFIPRSEAAAQESRFYAATGCTISGSFLAFFDAHGGVTVFGYPISDRITEAGRPVQYFERQRFEYHSEAAGTANEVQLGRLGAAMAPPQATARNSAPFQSTPDRIYVPQTRHSLSNAFLSYWLTNGD